MCMQDEELEALPRQYSLLRELPLHHNTHEAGGGSFSLEFSIFRIKVLMKGFYFIFFVGGKYQHFPLNSSQYSGQLHPNIMRKIN